MKKMILAMTVLALLATGTAQASDRKVMTPIDAAMADNNAQEKLAGVKFYFGNQPTPKVLKKLGSDTTSQKTNAFAKTDSKVCNWVFLSAMERLHHRAMELGANAVVNIVSNYGNIEYSSPTEFECHVGGIMGGVALKADFVKIAD